VKTPIHATSEEDGFGLDGAVPEEPLDHVARVMARAALGKPVRDLATTRRGTLNYALLRAAPRGVVDRVITTALRRLARRGNVKGSSVAGDLMQRLS
jgi:hypothetical protein